MKIILIIIFLTLSVFVNADAKEPITSIKILEKVELEYRSLKAYSDIGCVKSDNETITFKTIYAEPDRFVFVWSSEIKTTQPVIFNYAIWPDGEGLYQYYSYEKEIEPVENLDMAIAKATGVSLGAAHYISSMLGLVDGFNITKIVDPILIGEKVVDNVLCYQIKGKHFKYESTYDLFISKSTYLIKKIVKQSKVGKTETIYYKIEINPDLLKSVFDKKQIMENLRTLRDQ